MLFNFWRFDVDFVFDEDMTRVRLGNNSIASQWSLFWSWDNQSWIEMDRRIFRSSWRRRWWWRSPIGTEYETFDCRGKWRDVHLIKLLDLLDCLRMDDRRSRMPLSSWSHKSSALDVSHCLNSSHATRCFTRVLNLHTQTIFRIIPRNSILYSNRSIPLSPKSPRYRRFYRDMLARLIVRLYRDKSWYIVDTDDFLVSLFEKLHIHKKRRNLHEKGSWHQIDDVRTSSTPFGSCLSLERKDRIGRKYV